MKVWFAQTSNFPISDIVGQINFLKEMTCVYFCGFDPD